MRAFSDVAEQVDLIVIGGGIIGSGIARDAARRGLTVALFERDDFGSGTTAASTRLIHGGLRYLATGDLRLVRLDLRERETLLRIAPHLVAPLPFLLPFERGRAMERWKLRAGLLLYDALSYDTSLPAHRVLDARARRHLEPGLDATRCDGAAVYYDAQVFSPERLALENILDAAAHGALAVNHAEVTAPLYAADRLVGVQVKDRLTGEERLVRARLMVNAASTFAERYGFIVVAPMGYSVSSGWGERPGQPVATAQVKPGSAVRYSGGELAEIDAMSVLKMMRDKYTVDSGRIYLIMSSSFGVAPNTWRRCSSSLPRFRRIPT